MLKNNLSKNIILCLICVFLLSCNKEQKTEVLNKKANQLTFESFIPFVVKDKKYRVLPSMSEIFEDENYLVKQFDEVTFIIHDKNNDTNFCIKYSGGDNIYLDKNIKPTAIFLLDQKLLPLSVIYFEKNTEQKIYRYSKIEYSKENVYQLMSSNNDNVKISSMKIDELIGMLRNIEAGKVQFTNKIELPNEFLKTPLWEISW